MNIQRLNENTKVMKLISAAIVLLSASHVTAQAQPIGSGTLEGLVIDEAGRSQPGVQVRCRRLSTFVTTNGKMTPKEPGFTTSVVSGPSGVFEFSKLPAGRYHVCAIPGPRNQIGSCEWGGVPVIDLADGPKAAGFRAIIRDGALITVRVADPSRRIVLPDSRGFSARQGRFSLELVAPSGFQRRATRISAAGNEFVFQLTVPKAWTMRLFLDTDLPVRSAKGNPLEARRPTTETISPAGQDEVSVNLTVQ